MRLIFMGTPDFAVPALKALVNAGHEIVGVYTQPDRPAGRGKELKSSPVKRLAEQLGLAVFQPVKLKTAEVLVELRNLHPECIVVVAYGQILSGEILALPKFGCINVHASLLPKYRGAAPIHWAIMKGESLTGVTTMLMDEGLDTGGMLLKQEYGLSGEVTTGEVHDILAEYGSHLIVETLQAVETGSVVPVPQAGFSSYAPLLTRETERIDWSRSGRDIHNQIRGLNPWPGAYTVFRGENIKIWQSRVLNDGVGTTLRADSAEESPGAVVEVTEQGIKVRTGSGDLLIREVQPAGKKTMAARDFFLGRHGQNGEQFGNGD